MSHSTEPEKKPRYTVLTNAESVLWRTLLETAWAQMQGLFPRLGEFTGPRQRYYVRDETLRRAPNTPHEVSDEHTD